MPDRMQVVLDVDNTRAIAGTKASNEAIAGIKGAADSAAKGASDALDRIPAKIVPSVEASSKALERILGNLEQRASVAGKNTLDRLRIEEAATKAKFGSDEAAIQRV